MDLIESAFLWYSDYSEQESHLGLVRICLPHFKDEVYRVTDQLRKEQSSATIVKPGVFYVVATPIGNLSDISRRAVQILGQVDCVLAEDTRHSKRLLSHYGVNQKLRSCHEHNEESQIEWATQQLSAGASLALISDAGTPLISDPGFLLVRALRERGVEVIAIPGPSSIIAALSISGLPTDGFVYDGFLPAKSSGRKTALGRYLNESRTVLLLESSHRIEACLKDIVEVLGAERSVVVAREMTKKFETVLSGSAQHVLDTLKDDPDQTRGEFVVMLAGATPVSESEQQLGAILEALLAELPVKQATRIAAKITGQRKNLVYELALTLKENYK